MARILFFALVVRPFLLFWVGLNVLGRDNLPKTGPAIIAANHNSHMDALALMALFPLKRLHQVRAVAAADYFLKGSVLGLIANKLIGILPIERQRDNRTTDPIDVICNSLDQGHILILFPEGTRGDPEQLSDFKTGVARVVERRPDVRIIPAFLRGFGKVLPKGALLPVPFFCDIAFGPALPDFQSQKNTMKQLQSGLQRLARQLPNSD